MTRFHVRTLPFALVALLLSGCMAYIPTEVKELPVGQPVRIQLSRQAFADLPQISDRQGSRLEGTLVRKTDNEIVVHVPISIGAQLGQDVPIPANGVLSSDLRVLSRPRTALLVLGGFAVIVSAVVGSTSGKEIVMNNPPDNPGGDNEGFSGHGIMSALAHVLTFSIAAP